MPTRGAGTHGFELEGRRTVPVAVINPDVQSKVIGSVITLTGLASSSADGEELTYSWTFEETPIGSTVQEFSLGDATATFVPDMTGTYTVGLVVSTPYRISEKVTAEVAITRVLLPADLRTTPDGSVMFRLLSSFWRLVEDRDVLSTLWSGYMQVAASELLKVFQIDYEKSIETIQSVFQRRWIAYEPALELNHEELTAVYGHHKSGSKAFTSAGTSASSAVILSSREIRLLDGVASPSAIGSTLRVYSSGGSPGNLGEYTINRVNSDATGYIISSTKLFPAPADEVLSSASDMVTIAGSDEVYVADVSVNFTALGVVSGDILRIEGGADAGFYEITGVGTADGLANDRTLQVDGAPTRTGSGRAYTVLKRIDVYATRTAVASTDTVYIPASEADLSDFESQTLRGQGEVAGTYELVVERRHVLSAMVGQRIRITSGPDGGRTFTITGVNQSGTGYLLGAAVSNASRGLAVSYSLSSGVDISNRLLVLGDRAYPILRAVERTAAGVVEGDGLGPVWVVTLKAALAPSGREKLSWRIAAALWGPDDMDFEAEGVSAGDLLYLRAELPHNQTTAEVPFQVLGAYKNGVAFDLGTQDLADGTNGVLTDLQIFNLSNRLRVPRARFADENLEDLVLTLTAANVKSALESLAFESAYFNKPLSSSTVLRIYEDISAKMRPVRIVRNSRIPVPDHLLSVPSLFEYIAEPLVGTDTSGRVILAGVNGGSRVLQRVPLELVENRDFSISSNDTLGGTNLATMAGSASLSIPMGDLIDRGVQPGDFVDVLTGFDQGRYTIKAVTSSEELLVSADDGTLPAHTETGLRFKLVRRTAGNFIRFIDGLFSADSPAPSRLWGQISLYDNWQQIEDNFGVLVGVTKDQLDEFGSSQISYKGAVHGLMYAWTSGPTLRNVEIGASILLGLPVTEVDGRIRQIDNDYDTENSLGRILIEDLDRDGQGTGLVRIYFYSADDASTLSEFTGLATNPKTGSAFQVDDLVPAFTPLSRSVLVDDYLTDPEWWAIANPSGAGELQKFHTWQVQVDAWRVDSRDLPLIRDFCMGIRPIYTKPTVVLVAYLEDEVEITDQFSMTVTPFLSDDTVLSIEATHMTDSENNSSLSNYLLDKGTLATRTLFEGLDLETSAGSGTVTSARGGFAGTLDTDPLDHALDEDVGTLSGINDWFPDDVIYRGTPLVRAGDILFIRSGVNRGRYTITAVTDDNTLEVDRLDDWPPRTMDPADLATATDQRFQIQRLDIPELVSGTGTYVSYDAATNTSIISDADGNFRWNGCATGDSLLVENGPGLGYQVYEVLQVGNPDGLGGVENYDTRLTVLGDLSSASGDFSYTVRRERLRPNPLVEGDDGATTAGGYELTTAGTNLILEELQFGDELVPQSGTDEGKVFTVLHVIDNDTATVSDTFTATETGVEFLVRRPGRYESGDVYASTTEVESFAFEDAIELIIIEPVSSVLSLSDLDLNVTTPDPTDPSTWYATATSAATNIETSGVTTAMKLHVDNAHDNSGVYELTDVTTDTVTVVGLWQSEEDPITGEFYELDDQWEVTNDEVELLSGFASLEGVVVPGDKIQLDTLGTYVVLSVSGTTITLTEDTGVGVATRYTGRALRSVV